MGESCVIQINDNDKNPVCKHTENAAKKNEFMFLFS